MQELFYEETAVYRNEKSEKSKYYTFYVLCIFFLIVACAYVGLMLGTTDFDKLGTGNTFLNVLLIVIPAIGFLITSGLFFILKNKFCLDYDYTFVSGSLRISRVIKNSRRRFLYSFTTDKIEKLGKFGSDTFFDYLKFPNLKVVQLTANKSPSEGKDFFYLVVNNIDKTKVLLVFECTEQLMVNILKYSNKYIIEKDYK